MPVASDDKKSMTDENEDEKLAQESSTHESSSRVSPNVELSNEDSVHGDSSLANQTVLERRPTDPSKVFTCKFCKREFSTSYALGGHQNAHKQERAIAKMRKGMTFGAFNNYNQCYPYVGSSHHPYYGPWGNSLEVNISSLVHKPSYYPLFSSSNGSHRHCHGGFLKQVVATPLPSYQARIETVDAANGGNSGFNGSSMTIFDETKSSSLDKLHDGQVDDSGIDLSLKL